MFKKSFAVVLALSVLLLSTMASADPVPELFSKIGRALAKLPRKPAKKPWSSDGPRDPVPRDPARAQEALSLGIQRPRISVPGAALAGAGLGIAGITLLKKSKSAIKLGPMFTLGGGGLLLTAKFQ